MVFKKKRRAESQTHVRAFISDRMLIKNTKKKKGFKSDAAALRWLIRRKRN